jgi:hypothetical protein
MKISPQRFGCLLGTALAVAALPVLHPVAALAAPSCAASTDAGNRKTTISDKHFTWIVAQKDREENFSGNPEQVTFTVSASTTRQNSVKVTASVSVSVDALWASFQASVGSEVGSSTSRTEFASTTRQYYLNSGDSYYFGQGTGRWTATATVYQCGKVNIDMYGWREVGSASLVGFTGLTHAVVGCHQSVTAGSFSALLKQSC